MDDHLKLEDFHANLGRYIKISEEESGYIFSRLDSSKIPNRQFLLKQGELCTSFNMVTSGCLCNYFTDDHDIDHVLQFATKMWWTADLNSLMNNKPSKYNIRAVGDSTVLQLTRNTWDELNDVIPQFERYFRLIFQNALIAHQKRIIQNISETAEQNYLKFRENYPEVEQMVPQKYIASYLGITPEFLSKIRRELASR
ncbi:MAG: Crp/Fnr family transcriptional regulator [Balneolales bacterium]